MTKAKQLLAFLEGNVSTVQAKLAYLRNAYFRVVFGQFVASAAIAFLDDVAIISYNTGLQASYSTKHLALSAAQGIEELAKSAKVNMQAVYVVNQNGEIL